MVQIWTLCLEGTGWGHKLGSQKDDRVWASRSESDLNCPIWILQGHLLQGEVPLVQLSNKFTLCVDKNSHSLS